MENKTLEAVHRAALSKMAIDPVVLDLRGMTPLTDYFYICHGETARQNQAIAEAVTEALEEAGDRPHPPDGMKSAEWILLDGSEVIVHIFTPEKREFYSLERLWSDAPRVPLDGAEAPGQEEG